MTSSRLKKARCSIYLRNSNEKINFNLLIQEGIAFRCTEEAYLLFHPMATKFVNGKYERRKT
jgi:hypothetical protein